MKHLLILLISILLSSPVIGQSERPETIIIPVSGIGDVSNTRKIILQNTLEEQLKEHFMLISQERFEEVREKVFEELEYEECTEDRCIMMIQEMLQVENVFHLQLIGEGNDIQLNLKWITLEEKKNETDVCLGCGTFQLNDKVRGLVEKLVGEKPIVVRVVRKGKGILFRDTPYTKFVEGGKKWIKFGDEETQVKFEGEIVDGVPNGEGTETYPDGQKYVGVFKDGLPNGKGTLTSPDGQKHVGGWKDGRKNGQGIESSPGGEEFEGIWKNGEILNGKGSLILSNGEKYVGEWKDGVSQGTLISPDGKEYVGEFKDRKKHGQGTLTLPRGDKFIGEWKDGNPWTGKFYDKDGYIFGERLNGVKQ